MTQLWIRCVFVFLLALIAKALTAKEIPPNTFLANEIPARGISQYRISIGGGLSAQQETAGWAIPVSLMVRSADSPMFWGLDTGIHFWEFNKEDGSVERLNGLPLLATLTYEADNYGPVPYHPYVGFSVGPHLLDKVTGLTPTLEILLRMGAQFDVTKTFSLSLDTRFGLLGSQFMLLPQLTAGLNL